MHVLSFLSISSGYVGFFQSSISDPGAMRNAAAAAPVRVSLLPLFAVVVGLTTAATRNRVGPEGRIANELMPRGKMSAMMRVHHQQLGVLANAVTHRAAAAWACADFGQTPAGCIVEYWSRLSRHGQSKEEEYKPRLKFHLSKYVRTYIISWPGEKKIELVDFCPPYVREGEEKDIDAKVGGLWGSWDKRGGVFGDGGLDFVAVFSSALTQFLVPVSFSLFFSLLVSVFINRSRESLLLICATGIALPNNGRPTHVYITADASMP